jgi:hypothetical protein
VHKDGVLLEVFSEHSSKLTAALQLAEALSPIVLSRKPQEQMVLDTIPEKASREKTFMLDR